VRHLSLISIFLCCLVIVGGHAFGQERQSKAALAERARREFSERKYAAAEQDFRELTRIDPSNIYAYMFLGQSLFSQEKYAEAVEPYQKARELEKKQKVFSTTQRRILTDQLSMSYGMSGQIGKARTLLEEAVRQDPDYPLNYYNLCFCGVRRKGQDARWADLALDASLSSARVSTEICPRPPGLDGLAL